MKKKINIPNTNISSNIDKFTFLINHIFLIPNHSVPINIIRLNNDINSINFNTINPLINKQIFTKKTTFKSLTLFNKTYTNQTFDKFMKKFNI